MPIEFVQRLPVRRLGLSVVAYAKSLTNKSGKLPSDSKAPAT